MRRHAALARYALAVAAVAGVAFFFYRKRELFVGFGASIDHLNWYWVAAAAFAELASLPLLAEAQRIVLLAGGVEAGRLQMNLVTLASNAISMTVPAGVAVSGGYSFARYRRFGADTAVAAWAELAAGAIAFCALAALALLGAMVAGGRAELIVLPPLAVVFAGSAAAAAAFRYPVLLARALDLVRLRAGRSGRLLGGLGSRLSRAAGSLSDVRPPAAAWTAAWALSLLNSLLDAVCLVLSFAAVHAPVPWGTALVALAGAKVLASIGITPAGLGVADGGLVATLVAYGAAGGGVGAAVLVYRVLTFGGLAGIGWLGAARLAVTDRRPAQSPLARRGQAPGHEGR